MNIDIALWIGVASLVLAVPLAVIGNLISPRVASYLERRQLIKARRTKAQALRIYNRIRAFREGTRDRYPYYILLASSAVLCAVASSTIVVVVVLISPSFEPGAVFLLIALLLALLAVAFLAGIYETARQLERFDDYKKEFEDRWGPLDENDLKN
jgi:hypothetical protein